MARLTSLSLFAVAVAASGGLPLFVQAQQPASAPPPSEPPVVAAPAQARPAAAVNQQTEPTATTAQSEGKGWLLAGAVQIKTSDKGIRYASGGVGESEREELRAISNQFNLRVMSAMQGGGEYLADVQVNILDSHGATILSANSKGPFFLAQLPSGSYTVEVAANGKTQKQSTQVGNGQAQVNFYWH